jgi:uncharacterized membrane protein YbaN (DUF454 family)
MKSIKIIAIIFALINFTLSIYLVNGMAICGWFTALIFMLSAYFYEERKF